MVILKQWYSQGDSCPPLRLQGRAQKFEKGGGRCNFLFLFPPKISVKTKKKVFTSFDVQFTPKIK